MRKLILIFLMLASLTLTACIPEVQSTPTATATTAVTATSVSRPAPTVVLNVPTQTNLLPDSGCTVVSKKPTPGPTAESIFPAVSDTDWVIGPASAKVTIIEYSDFQ